MPPKCTSGSVLTQLRHEGTESGPVRRRLPLRGFPAHLKHRLKSPPRQSPDPNAERATTTYSAASTTQNTRGILGGKIVVQLVQIPWYFDNREKSSQMLQAFLDQEVDDLTSKFAP